VRVLSELCLKSGGRRVHASLQLRQSLGVAIPAVNGSAPGATVEVEKLYAFIG